jgi:hypothetical protein
MKKNHFNRVAFLGPYSVLGLCLTLCGVVQAQAQWRPPETINNDYQWLQQRINEECGPRDTSGIKLTIQNGTTSAHNYSITLKCRKDRAYTTWIVDTRVIAGTTIGENDVLGVSKDLGLIYGLAGNTVIRVRKQDD